MKHNLQTYTVWPFPRKSITFGAAFLPALLWLITVTAGQAGSATWSATPLNNKWNSASNWNPNTVPKRPVDTATFATSSITNPSISGTIALNGFTFNSGANPFTINGRGSFVTIDGAGIVNSSTIVQNLILSPTAQASSLIDFTNSANAGAQTTYTLKGATPSTGLNYGYVDFHDNSTAGAANFVLQGSGFANQYGSGTVDFYDNSTAADASFTINGATAGFTYGGYLYYGSSASSTLNGDLTINGGTVSNAYGGDAYFDTMSNVTFNASVTIKSTPGNYGGELDMYSAEATFNGPVIISSGGNQPLYVGAYIAPQLITINGLFTVNGGTANRFGGGYVYFLPQAVNPGTGSIVVNGGSVSGAGGGVMTCQDFDAGVNSYAVNGGNGANATGGFLNLYDTHGVSGILIANGGINRGLGGNINIVSSEAGTLGRLEAFGNGSINFSSWDVDPQNVGSIEGSGTITGDNLWTGSNNLSTTFSGTLSIASLTKVGTGVLTLSKANTYSGGTTISDGTLLVTNTTGSATGTGIVNASTGNLAGTGIMTGAVTVGMSTGNSGYISPGNNGVGFLTTKGALTFLATGTYNCELDSSAITADQVTAKGVTINSDAVISLVDLAGNLVPAGTVFTLINNTANAPISGAFSNLADGSTVMIGNNTYDASYSGGTGNDLTLTVQ